MIVDPARRARSPASTVSRWMDSTLVSVSCSWRNVLRSQGPGRGRDASVPTLTPSWVRGHHPASDPGTPAQRRGEWAVQYSVCAEPSGESGTDPMAKRATSDEVRLTSGPRRRDRDVIMAQRCMEHAYLAQPTRSWGLVLVLVTLTGRHDSPPRHPSIRVGGPVIGSPMVSRSSTTVVSPGLTVTVASGSLASL
jgi:hypothetical protein